MPDKKICPLLTAAALPSSGEYGESDCLEARCGFWVDGSWLIDGGPRVDAKGYRPGGCGISFPGCGESTLASEEKGRTHA